MLFLCIYKKENIREINWIRYFQSSLRILFFGIYLRFRIINGYVSSHTYNLSWRFLRKSFITIYPVILPLRLCCLILPESDNGIFLDRNGIHIISPKWSLKYLSIESSVQFSSVAQSCLTLCYPMDCSTPVLPVRHQIPELTQTHVHWVGDAIQPSHPLWSLCPPSLNLCQHQGLFQWVGSSHQVAKVLALQHQPFRWKLVLLNSFFR